MTEQRTKHRKSSHTDVGVRKKISNTHETVKQMPPALDIKRIVLANTNVNLYSCTPTFRKAVHAPIDLRKRGSCN